jgi:hypothetical protein
MKNPAFYPINGVLIASATLFLIAVMAIVQDMTIRTDIAIKLLIFWDF